MTPSAPDATLGRAPALVLRSSTFRREREAGWRELEDLITRIERRGVGSLDARELERLPLLYAAALSSLSVARSIALDRNLLAYLENLCLRGFLTVHARREPFSLAMRTFFASDFPRAVRQARWHIAIVLVFLLAGGVVGYVLTVGDESWMRVFVPSGMAGGRGPQSSREELMAGEIFAPWPGAVQSFIVFANYLFQNNTMVGILAFSLGFLAGVPTLLLIAYQGLLVGSMIALHANRDLTVEFLGWISIHGVIEITAIVLCGAGGLLIAEKVLFPGQYGRLDNLARHGRTATQIAIGCVVLFLLAGLIEGGLRQLVQPTGLRFAIGAATGLTLAAWILLGGRGERAP